MSASAPLLSTLSGCAPPQKRRCGNYVPPAWDAHFLESITTDPLDENQTRRIDELHAKVAYQLGACACKPSMLLELVDSIQQLGIGYRFEGEITGALHRVSEDREQVLAEKDLRSTSLLFRLLRASGMTISQDVFEVFRDEDDGSWGSCLLRNDPRRILSLYEASYLSFEGEESMDEIKVLTTTLLREIEASTADANLKEKVTYALKIPLNWRFARFHHLWFMKAYAKEEGRNPEVLELARLDFHRVQLHYRREIKNISRWWVKTGLGEQIDFSRDRVVEQFIWALATASFEPQCGDCREWIVKTTILVTLIDDTYDVHGTLDELHMFTDIVERWAVEDIDMLPKYMQILFMALFNHVNDLTYDMLKEKKVNIRVQVRRLWVQLIKAYFQEAKWYHNHITPSLEEYLNIATITAGTVHLLSYVYIINSKDVNTNTLDWIYENKGLTRLTNIIVRFTNDIGTSKDERERGDAPSAMDCYMHQENISEEEARNHIKCEIDKTWKIINKTKYGNPHLPKSLVAGFLDFGRVCHFTYQKGDGFSFPPEEMHAALKSLFFEPVALVD